MAFCTGRFCNRGVLNAPVCPAYGLVMVILLMLEPTSRGREVFLFIACIVVASAGAALSGSAAKSLMGDSLWDYEQKNGFSGDKKGLLYALILGTGAMTTIQLIHPMLFILCSIIPVIVMKIGTVICSLVLLVDLSSVVYAARKQPVTEGVQVLSEELKEQKDTLGEKIYQAIWRRLKKAYPGLKAAKSGMREKDSGYVFAQGICVNKLIWVFFISALMGDIIETLYVRAVGGVWMKRSSVLYGPFSIVWGVGAVLLTVLLHRLADKEDRYIFLGGFFLGGTYEYLCSVFTEIFLGTTFWDYSDMPFNIGGRTNLLFCIFWGILALVWVKLCYPYISRWIEMLPAVLGMVVTWAAVFLMVCDMAISGLAMIRYVERRNEAPASNVIEVFLDDMYPDSMIENAWPNMNIPVQSSLGFKQQRHTS